MTLAKRLRIAWLWEPVRESSIVVSLPANAVLDVLAKSVTEPPGSLSYSRYYLETLGGSRKWIENPYGGSIGISRITLFQNFVWRFQSLGLVVEGVLVPEPRGTRIRLRFGVMQFQQLFATIWLTFVGTMQILVLWSLLTKGITIGTLLFIFVPMFLLISGVGLYQSARSVVEEEAVSAEQWLLTLFRSYNPVLSTDRS